jgi:hypothetical protein
MVVSLLAAPRTAAATGGRSRPQWDRSPPPLTRSVARRTDHRSCSKAILTLVAPPGRPG